MSLELVHSRVKRPLEWRARHFSHHVIINLEPFILAPDRDEIVTAMHHPHVEHDRKEVAALENFRQIYN